MSKSEVNRAILRAFGDAARLIQRPTVEGRVGGWAEAQRLRRHAGWYDVPGTLISRRRRVYARAIAAAADTAFGL